MKLAVQILIVIVVVSIAANIVFAQQKIIVGYYPSWMSVALPPSAIEYQNLTHIAHAFVAPNADGSISYSDGFSLLPSLISTAHLHNVKVMISLGGWGNSAGFSPMAADTAARHRFVQNLKNFCVTNGYDGADVDWEYPAGSDKTNLTLLVHELRQAFNAVNPPLQLSLAAPSTDWSGKNFDFASLQNDVSWIGIMTYDYYTGMKMAGPNSALYGNFSTNSQGWVDYSVQYFSLTRGIAKQKLLIGIPFYGMLFNASKLYGTSTTAGTSALYSTVLPKLLLGWTRNWDEQGKVPYLVNSTQTQIISYDDSESVALKCDYVLNQDLGGTIIWALGQDLIDGKEALLDVVGNTLGMVSSAPVVSNAEDPSSFAVYQNYPNPFNGETRIQYAIPENGMVRIMLYDVMGRLVSTIVDREETAGTHMALFSLPALASGIYIYRITWQGSSLAKTMVVLR